MANLNRVFLMGNLTRDPELRYTPSGTAVTNLRIAVNRRFKTQTGEVKEETAFITVVAWGKQAETCTQFLTKGKPIFVEGRLQMRSWETADGQKRNVLEVRASRVQFLGRPQLSQEEGQDTQATKEESLDALFSSNDQNTIEEDKDFNSKEVPF
ncbi:MAG: single-stranded DNA-binding protein [Candidatus Omnitrophica bacterium]|nr:single-stranded DNA-binding protein [Candidatus Omnitrophota bacterium]